MWRRRSVQCVATRRLGLTTVVHNCTHRVAQSRAAGPPRPRASDVSATSSSSLSRSSRVRASREQVGPPPRCVGEWLTAGALAHSHNRLPRTRARAVNPSIARACSCALELAASGRSNTASALHNARCAARARARETWSSSNAQKQTVDRARSGFAALSSGRIDRQPHARTRSWRSKQA